MSQLSFDFGKKSYAESRGSCPNCVKSCGHALSSDKEKKLPGLRQLKPSEIVDVFSKDVDTLLVSIQIEGVKIEHQDFSRRNIPIALSQTNEGTLICKRSQHAINTILSNPIHEKRIRSWLEENGPKLVWD